MSSRDEPSGGGTRHSCNKQCSGHCRRGLCGRVKDKKEWFALEDAITEPVNGIICSRTKCKAFENSRAINGVSSHSLVVSEILRENFDGQGESLELRGKLVQSSAKLSLGVQCLSSEDSFPRTCRAV